MAKSNTAKAKAAMLAVIENPSSTTEEKLRAAALFSRKPRKHKPKTVRNDGGIDSIPAQGPFMIEDFLERISKTMYDGERGKLLREYHTALERWTTEFHKADKDLAALNALWRVVVSAHQAVFGTETSLGLEGRRRQEEYYEEEKARLSRLGPASNACVRVSR
jgi:hypothetical protein